MPFLLGSCSHLVNQSSSPWSAEGKLSNTITPKSRGTSGVTVFPWHWTFGYHALCSATHFKANPFHSFWVSDITIE